MYIHSYTDMYQKDRICDRLSETAIYICMYVHVNGIANSSAAFI